MQAAKGTCQKAFIHFEHGIHEQIAEIEERKGEEKELDDGWQRHEEFNYRFSHFPLNWFWNEKIVKQIRRIISKKNQNGTADYSYVDNRPISSKTAKRQVYEEKKEGRRATN